MEPFTGQIQSFAFNFAPSDWVLCNGQSMSIAQNQAPFALIGTTYGGDGQSTSALPDLRGLVPNHFGQGPGLNNYEMGEVSGTENVTLLQPQMPVHSHMMMGSNRPALANDPTGHALAASTGSDLVNGATVTVNTYRTTPNRHGQSAGNQHSGWQPAPQQYAASPGPELLHGAGGSFPEP